MQDANGAIISSEVHFVEVDADGVIQPGGGAPYLDYRPPNEGEKAAIASLLERVTLPDDIQVAGQITAFAVERLIPDHLNRVQERRQALITRTLAAVQERLTREINHWDARANELRAQERAGKSPRLNSDKAARRADDLAARLKQRMAELEAERNVSATPPILIGRALVIPLGALRSELSAGLLDTRITEQIAMRAVMQTEIALGHDPRDVSSVKLGYDIESRDGNTGSLRFIEVKGRSASSETVTLTANEIRTALNSSSAFILALVEVENDEASPPRYIRQRFASREPDFGVSGVNYHVKDLLELSEVAT